jgi:hypothetical protein
MKMFILSAALLAFSLPFARPAAAVERVMVHPAQIMTPYGSEMGKVVTIGNQMVFVDDANPANSFALTRGEITNLNINNGMMTMSLAQPFTSPFSSGPTMMVRLLDANAGDLLSWMGAPNGTVGEASRVIVDQPNLYEYTVRHDDDEGRLIIGPVDVRFESFNHPKHSRAWTYNSIKKLSSDADDHELKLEPYSSDTYKFKVLGSKVLTEDVYAMVRERIAAARQR